MKCSRGQLRNNGACCARENARVRFQLRTAFTTTSTTVISTVDAAAATTTITTLLLRPLLLLLLHLLSVMKLLKSAL